MIRTNPLATALVSMLFILSLVCCWCAAWWFFGARELQVMRLQYQFMNKITSTVQGLANEAMDYSRRNPSIDPILQQFEIKPRTAGAPAGTPPTGTPPPATPGSPAKPTR
jgi:hypothetical protein